MRTLINVSYSLCEYPIDSYSEENNLPTSLFCDNLTYLYRENDTTLFSDSSSLKTYIFVNGNAR